MKIENICRRNYVLRMPPTKYATVEEKQAAVREQKRLWALKHRQQVKDKTYAEKIAAMTPEKYRAFLDRQKIYNKTCRAKKKDPVDLEDTETK